MCSDLSFLLRTYFEKQGWRFRAYPQIRRYDKIATKVGGRNGREKEL